MIVVAALVAVVVWIDVERLDAGRPSAGDIGPQRVTGVDTRPGFDAQVSECEGEDAWIGFGYTDQVAVDDELDLDAGSWAGLTQTRRCEGPLDCAVGVGDDSYPEVLGQPVESFPRQRECVGPDVRMPVRLEPQLARLVAVLGS